MGPLHPLSDPAPVGWVTHGVWSHTDSCQVQTSAWQGQAPPRVTARCKSVQSIKAIEGASLKVRSGKPPPRVAWPSSPLLFPSWAAAYPSLLPTSPEHPSSPPRHASIQIWDILWAPEKKNGTPGCQVMVR